jgi:hypothetical protein
MLHLLCGVQHWLQLGPNQVHLQARNGYGGRRNALLALGDGEWSRAAFTRDGAAQSLLDKA